MAQSTIAEVDLTDKLILSARNGAIDVRFLRDSMAGIELPTSASPKVVAAFLVENDVRSWMNSSSMDFATEYGFDEDDLRAIIEDEMYRLVSKKGTPA